MLQHQILKIKGSYRLFIKGISSNELDVEKLAKAKLFEFHFSVEELSMLLVQETPSAQKNIVQVN